MRVLLVEDDRPLSQALQGTLERHGLVIDVVHSISMAESALRLGVHDAMLLDRALPDGDGVGFIATARSIAQSLPIIVMTARGEVLDRVEGLNVGADDYVVKPVATDELLARLRAVARRPSAPVLSEAAIGRLRFDFNTQEARVDDGEPLRLQRRQLLILEALIYRQGRTVRREALREAVYGIDDDIQSNALDAHISKIRKVLDESGAEVEIAVIRGVGYLLRARP